MADLSDLAEAQGAFTVAGVELWQWRSQAQAQAQAAGVNPQDVDWLLLAVASLSSLDLKLGTLRDRAVVALDRPLPELTRAWDRRLNQRVPVQYLAGRTPWRHLQLQVTPAVLIPRPETELIIDIAVAASRQSPPDSQGIWADLGTGSGAIALGLAQALPQATVLATDVSAAALAVAQQNIARCGFADRVRCLQGSWCEPLDPWRGTLQGILANPPYIPSATMATLAPEVVTNEPRLALDGGPTGLASLEVLAAEAPVYLVPGGLWLCEMMIGQGAAVTALLEDRRAYTDIQIHLDLTGRERFVSARRRMD